MNDDHKDKNGQPCVGVTGNCVTWLPLDIPQLILAQLSMHTAAPGAVSLHMSKGDFCKSK